MTGEQPPIVPVAVATSPRVLWAALGSEVGLALWLRRSLSPLARQVEAILRGPEFDLAVDGIPADLEDAVRRGLPSGGAADAGPLVTDIAVLAELYSRLTGCSALRLRPSCVRREAATPLLVAKAGLALPCCYGGLGAEWQDAAGTVRRMPPSQVGLLKGRDWPDDAVRVPYLLPAVSLSGGGRLLLRLHHLAHA